MVNNVVWVGLLLNWGSLIFFAKNMIDPDQKPDRSRILIHDINFIEIKSSNNDTERVHHLAFYRKIFFKLLFRKYSKIFSKLFQEIIQKKDRSFLQKITINICPIKIIVLYKR